MIKLEWLINGIRTARARLRENWATRRGYVSGFSQAYFIAGALQAGVFAQTVTAYGLKLSMLGFVKFCLIWPAWSYAQIERDYVTGVWVIETTTKARIPPSPKVIVPAPKRGLSV